MARIQSVQKDEMIRALKQCGSRTASPEQLEADIAAGAPVNDDGTINMIAYAAWILKGNLNGD